MRVSKSSGVQRGSVVTPITGVELATSSSYNIQPRPTNTHSRGSKTSPKRLRLILSLMTQKSGDGQPIDESPPPEGGFRAVSVFVASQMAL